MEMDFVNLVQDRRSASNFLTDQVIEQKELNEIFELVKLGPSAFNLQHTRYVTVVDPDLKEKVRKAANGQYKVSSASAVIFVVGDKKAYQQAPEIYEGLQLLGIVNKQEYDHMVNDTVSFYETRGEVFQRDEAIRNASLSAMLFMLAAKEKGWDTCPMIGFNQEEIRGLLKIDEQYEVVLMITIGKEKVSSRKPRGYRKPVSEFVTYI
ncbi:nitroreductase family protein [Cytobacillus solani]|uniref:NAD(P)H nitroreductase n=2 Tax=Cytobacillus solani TaxID=1637975 RepID=A0A0Q3VHE5_9BACI|nr:nitroreductase family protein [Cytobacillus solani]KOP82690.1 NAD(P)H nitroreductase [Bacillus sp. FJAT-21945]KQL19703.1 NAD(P)H nitroreductase [Cytobacillus solani]USK52931.1 nitroreductase family protein [Cytobacillus solani]